MQCVHASPQNLIQVSPLMPEIAFPEIAFPKEDVDDVESHGTLFFREVYIKIIQNIVVRHQEQINIKTVLHKFLMILNL